MAGVKLLGAVEMSVKVLAKVWDGFPGGGSELLALLALADWSDDDGRCWPAIAAIAKKTRLSRSQTQRTVHALIATGYVVVTGNETGGAPGSTRQYRIALSKLTGSTDATPTGSVGATGSAHAQEGSHPCTKTGSTHATQTVSEPSVHVNTREQARTVPDCPHRDVIALYAKHLPMLPQPVVWNGSRADNLRYRWRWVLTDKRPNGTRYATTTEEALDFFDRYFTYVSESDFLTGRNGKWTSCDLGWLVKADNFAKVLQGNYENREAA